jgi:hypothetical protein
MNYLPRLALNHDPTDLCLLSSWDCKHEHCKHEPLAPGLGFFFFFFLH